MENLPVYVKVVFVLTTFLTIFLFYRATRKSTLTLGILFIWLAFQSFMGRFRFLYRDRNNPSAIFAIDWSSAPIYHCIIFNTQRKGIFGYAWI